MKNQIKGSLILLLTATIWGFAFVAQSAGMDYIGAFTFNSIRSIIGGIVLIPCIYIIRKLKKDTVKPRFNRKVTGTKNSVDEIVQNSEKKANGNFGTLFMGGISCGALLCIASNLQQLALKTAPVGKAGFITAMYIVMVPIVGLFLKKRVGKQTILGVLLAVCGLYLLCMKQDVGIFMTEDYLLLMATLVFTFHILVIDYFASRVDCVAMSCIQFFTCGILSAIPMLIFEEIKLGSIIDAAGPVLYAGILSCGVAYTLQMVGQRYMNPTVASMILSLESVVSVIAGFLVLDEKMSVREMTGCILMFVAIIISQLPEKKECNI